MAATATNKPDTVIYDLTVERSALKDVLRVCLHAILFHRVIGSIAPGTLEYLGDDFAIVEDSEIKALVEGKVDECGKTLEQQSGGRNYGYSVSGGWTGGNKHRFQVVILFLENPSTIPPSISTTPPVASTSQSPISNASPTPPPPQSQPTPAPAPQSKSRGWFPVSRPRLSHPPPVNSTQGTQLAGLPSPTSTQPFTPSTLAPSSSPQPSSPLNPSSQIPQAQSSSSQSQSSSQTLPFELHLFNFLISPSLPPHTSSKSRFESERSLRRQLKGVVIKTAEWCGSREGRDRLPAITSQERMPYGVRILINPSSSTFPYSLPSADPSRRSGQNSGAAWEGQPMERWKAMIAEPV